MVISRQVFSPNISDPKTFFKGFKAEKIGSLAYVLMELCELS